MAQLKASELAEYRARLLQIQQMICPLCSGRMSPDEAVLDHDHKTGHVRSVVHRGCNFIEGKVNHWVKRAKCSKSLFLYNLQVYYKRDYTNKPLHPTVRRKSRGK